MIIIVALFRRACENWISLDGTLILEMWTIYNHFFLLKTKHTLDRALISKSWSDKFPNTVQQALYSNLSDHCPLLCTISSTFPLPNTFRFENYWLKLQDFAPLVTSNWQSLPVVLNPAQFALKLRNLRRCIKQWSNTKVGTIDSQQAVCKQVLLWLTAAQEVKNLTELERVLTTVLTERLSQIEELLETKWKQRAKRQWLKEGDKNTKYFHAVASQQKRINCITSVISEGNEITQHTLKAKLFFDYYCQLVGTQGEAAMDFQLNALYAHNKLSATEASLLIEPWTDHDIKQAISSWKAGKSPGPDGFTGEFYNKFIDLLLPDFKEIFMAVNQHPHITLHPLNDSFIVLVPKKDPATSPADFRPISLVNAVQKIYSKIAAVKIKPLLHKLLAPNQTGFLKQRNILHGFTYAQQVLQSATKQRVQIAVLKADIFKAFDTIDWNFMFSILNARGFPQPWVRQIQNCVLKGSSRIIINGVAGRAITLRRGVRQGDPVSPYLFNLAIDFLSSWMQNLTDRNFLTPPFPQCKPCLLYADDTLILLKPDRTQLLKCKLILDIFGLLSGLKINSLKSELAITSPQPSQTHSLAEVIHCKPAAFPIQYLGLPLTGKKLSKTEYLPLINKVQKVLSGWKAPLLTIGGRLILTNVVLTAIPHYFMSVFLLPAWVTHKIDKIRKRFLWHGHKDEQR